MATNNKETNKQSILSKMAFWRPVSSPGGNILEGSTQQLDKPVLNEAMVKAMEPYGSLPKHSKQRSSGWSQIQNLSHDFDIQKVQSAFRAAERGDLTRLFAYYRDFFIGNGMVAAALSKRKLSTISEPFNIIPVDKNNKDDVIAAKTIKQVLDNCESFDTAVIHLLNAIVFPVAALEKTFEEVDERDFGGNNEFNIRYKIKKLLPIDYQLLTYRLPYLPQGPINIGNQPAVVNAPFIQSISGRSEDTIFDPDSWEPDLRFWSVFDNGLINYSYAYMQQPDKDRHIIYRTNLLQGIARENFGGLGKSILWWAIMSQLGTDVFLRCLQKYGLPFIKIQADTAQIDTVNQMIQTFADVSNVLNAIVVNKDAIVELDEMNYSGAADAHSKFLEFCQNQINLLILGQVLDSQNSTGGLGNGGKSLQREVRSDIINYDQRSLNNVLRHGLFRQILDINGIKGATPNIIWGGDDVADMTELSSVISNLYKAGLEPTDDAIEMLSEKLGYTIQRMNSNITSNSGSAFKTKTDIQAEGEISKLKDDKESINE